MGAWKGVKRLVRRAGAALVSDRASLSVFLFHTLFENEAEIAAGLVAPHHGLTVEHFRRFVGHYRSRGYAFVTPDDLLAGLSPEGRHVMITFDDGYANNARALPVMEEFQVPAVFFVSTGHVREGKAFFWDVVHRERRRRGASEKEVRAEIASLKRLDPGRIEQHLLEAFGAAALEPRGDLDRPFEPDELRSFSAHPLVHPANHTRDHAILVNLDAAAVEAQVRGAQEDLEELCGPTAPAIAYPNGDHSPLVVETLRRAGMKLGFTVERGKIYPPFGGAALDRMRIGRFSLWGGEDIDSQCARLRSDFSWRGMTAPRSGKDRKR